MHPARLAALVALLTIALVAPASANQWYIQTGGHGRRARIPAGQSVEITTEGRMNLKILLTGKRGRVNSTCHIDGRELLSNPTTTEAWASTEALDFSECTGGVSVVSEFVPWSGELVSDCMPCDITRPTDLDVSVDGTDYGTFEGLVSAKVGDPDNPNKDEPDHTFKWSAIKPVSNKLEGESGVVKVGGFMVLGAEGDRASGERNQGPAEEEESAAEAGRRAARRAAGLPGDGDGD